MTTDALELGVAILVLAGVLAFGVFRIEKAKRAAKSTIAGLSEGSVAEILEARDEPRLNAVRAWLDAEVVGREGDKFVVRTNPTVGLRALLAQEFDRIALPGLGNVLTGLSLVITFVLIGWVLVNDLTAAIGGGGSVADGGAQEAGRYLSAAVGRMGEKFFVSATGVGTSLIHRLFLSRARASVHKAEEAAFTVVARQFVSLEMVRLAHERDLLARLARLDGRLEDGVTRLSADIGRLQSIEVSVKDLGTEVSAGLGRMMKDTLAEQIQTLLEDMKGSAERIQEDVQTFAEAALKRTADEIVGELRAVNETLRGQAGSQVEQLLTKLQDAVSGGFSAESRNMAAQFAQFGEVIPQLAGQMNGVVGRMETLLESLAQQQVESSRTMGALAASARTQAQEFGEAFAKSGQEALGRVISETAQGADGLIRALETVVQQSHASSDSVRKNLNDAGEAVAAALAETQQSARAVELQMKALTTGLAAAAQNAQTLQGGSDSLGRSLGALHSTVEKMGKIGSTVGELLSTQMNVQQEQTRLLDQMQSVWPQLLDVVASRVRDSTQSLNSAWGQAANQLEHATGAHVSRFASAVEELSDTVASLQAAIGERRKAVGG